MPSDISDNKPNTDLIFTFGDAFVPMLFDDDMTHGMFHRMQKVDFIVTSAEQTWLVEVKDPQSRRIPAQHRADRQAHFLKEIESGKLFSGGLAPKLKDTLLYLTLQNHAPANAIRYIVCLGMDVFDDAMLLSLKDDLSKHLNLLPGPFGKDWNSHFDVIVLNIAAWNEQLKPHLVRRP